MFSLWLQDFLEDDVQVLRDNRQEERRKKKKKSQQMQSKKSSNNNTELISGNCALCWSAEITNPRGCVQGRKVSSSPGCIIQEKRFNNRWTSRSGRRASEKSFFPACSPLASTHTTARGGADFLPGAAPLMSAATWAPGSGDALSPAARFQGSGGKVEAVPPPRGHLEHVQHLLQR